MKESTAKLMKKVAHVLLFGISTILTVLLFIQFSNEPLVQIVWGTFAFTVELVKIFSVLELKLFWKQQKFKIAIGMSIVYCCLAFVSISASLNFTMLSIQNQSFTSRQQNNNVYSYDERIEELSRDIQIYNRMIEDKLKKSEEAPSLYTAAGSAISEELRQYREDKQALVDEKTRLLNEKAEASENMVITSIDSFTLMGEKIGLTGEQVMFYLMGLLVLVLEVVLAMTSGEISGTVKVSENRGKLVKYVNALMDVNGIRLNSDSKISELTGLTIHECKRFKGLLQEWKYDGIELIKTGRGGSRANFTQKQILQIVNARTKMGL